MNDRPNGKDQVEAMRKLCNPEQRAPNDEWQPDQLGGFRVGDLVRLPSLAGALEIVALKPPSLLILRTPTGATVQAGWRAVSRAHLHSRKKARRSGNGT